MYYTGHPRTLAPEKQGWRLSECALSPCRPRGKEGEGTFWLQHPPFPTIHSCSLGTSKAQRCNLQVPTLCILTPPPPRPAPPREAGHKEPPVPAPTAQSARSGHPLPPRAPAFPIPPWASLRGLSPLVPDVPPLFIPLETRRGCGYTPTGSGVVLNPQWLRPEALCCQSSEGSASFWALDAERSLSWGLLVPARGLQSSEPQICSGCDPSGGRHTGGLLAGRSPAAAS